jgi:hypothetical protein
MDRSAVPLEAWRMVCGTAVAARAEASSFDGKRLTIAVTDAQWKAQLEGMSAVYLRSLNEISPVRIEALDFVVRSKRTADKR